MSPDEAATATPNGQKASSNPWMWVSIVLGVLLVAVAIYYFLTTGQKVTVPDVVGKQQVEAVQMLNDDGLKLGSVSSTVTDAVPKGQIVSQDPAAGTEVDSGAEVALVVSEGSGTVTVPDVVGTSSSEAQQTLSALGLAVTTSEQYDATATAGTVFAQVPEAGSEAAPGSAIVIAVSKGTAPAQTAVPNVVGTTQADAEKTLTSVGLKVATTEAYSDTVAKGAVGGQLPAADTKVTPGSEVQIYVSLGKGVASVTVPKVTGMTEAKAVDALKSANLTSKVYRTFSATAAAGTVFAQVPAAGTKTGAGTQVGIAVSLGKDTGLVSVPNVVGKPSEEASAAIAAAGLVPLAVADFSAEPSGTVSKQLPLSDSSVPPGSTVIYLVSKGPKP